MDKAKKRESLSEMDEGPQQHAGERRSGQTSRRRGKKTPNAIERTHRDPGATLERMEQHDFYRTLRDKRKMPQRRTADQNVETIQEPPQETSNKRSKTERFWLATKHKDLKRKTRDLLWKSVQEMYKTRTFWSCIDGYEERASVRAATREKI